ncbi:MAG TPA: serine/threonine-protein kinase, partial [Polyangiaceae bacterium LLY-WYZ-15_(1-7)]|nr:serine/threonine-protein kinase [Polyangiaceae bacterium LLY-WYZ-15_(1-7)]
LRKEHGATHVRNVFHDRWPTEASELGRFTAKQAIRIGLDVEIAAVLGESASSVRRRLEGHHGRTLVRNVFGDSPFFEIAEWEPTGAGWPRGLVSDGGALEEDGADPGEGPGDEHDKVAEDVLDLDASSSVSADLHSGVGSWAPAETGVGPLVRGRYRITGPLGEGGFGRTFEATDTFVKGRRVVLKFPLESEGEERLEREFLRAWAAHHQHVCRAELDRDELGRSFLVLEHGGRSVSAVLEDEGPLAPELAIDIVGQIAGALDHAHGRQILHLDVSPGNVLLDDQRFARLSDFGSAAEGERLFEDGKTTMLAKVDSYTRAYAAPELVLEHLGNPRSDQFSLALLLHSMLVGEVRTRRRRPRAASGWPGLTDAQRAVVRRALDREPSRRHPSCGAFVAALHAAADPTPGSALRRRLGELLSRIDTELGRGGSASATTRVGGSMLVGGALEALLRSAVHVVVEAHDALDEAAVLEALQAVNRRAQSVERAPLGTLCEILYRWQKRGFELPAELAPLEPMLGDSGSALGRAVAGRNDVAHGRSQELPAELLAELRRFVRKWGERLGP